MSSYILYPASRYDVRGRRYLQRQDKYYLVDTGLRYALLGDRNVDRGHILKNIVYLEMLRRGWRVYAGVYGALEIDFIVEESQRTQAIQVCLSVRDRLTLERELTPLRRATAFNRRLLLTLDDDPPASYDGIEQLNVLDWLLATE